MAISRGVSAEELELTLSTVGPQSDQASGSVSPVTMGSVWGLEEGSMVRKFCSSLEMMRAWRKLWQREGEVQGEWQSVETCESWVGGCRTELWREARERGEWSLMCGPSSLVF